MPEKGPKITPEVTPEVTAVEKEHQLLEGVVFEKLQKSKGRAEYRSSDPSRKIVILESGTTFEPEEGKAYNVEIVQDTNPDDPTKGKLIVRVAGLEEAPILEQKLTAAGHPFPVEVDEESGKVLVLETELPLNREGGPLVPDSQKFEHFTLDKRTLETMEKIATAVELRQPCLLEGPTATSKTSSIEYVAMKTGNEVIRFNFNGQTDTSELIGKFVPNEGQLNIKFEDLFRHLERLSDQSKEILEKANKEGRGLSLVESQKIAKAEGLKVGDWRWQDGAAIRAAKEGKWLILDELTLGEPQIRERLNSLLEKYPSLAVSEHQGEVIRELSPEEIELYKQGKLPNVEPLHPNFRIFAATNPAEYAARYPMTPAEKDRYTSYKYIAAPTEVDYRDMMNLVVYGEQPVVEIRNQKYGGEKKNPLFETLNGIPNFSEFIAKMAKFQATMENYSRTREIGRGRKEEYVFTRRGLFEFLTYLEDKSFVDRRTGKKRTIEDAPKEVILSALQYYYLDKMSNPDDLAKVQDQLDAIGISSKKWILKFGESLKPETLKRVPGQEKSGKMEIREARELFREDFLGPEAIRAAFGFEPKPEQIPDIPFSKKELERATELGQFLVLRINETPDGKPLTMEKMNELKKGLASVDWYANEDFYKKETPRLGWALVSHEVLPDSTGKNYAQQIDKVMVDYLKNQVFQGQPPPKEYEEAFKEWEEARKQEDIKKLLDHPDEVASGKISYDWKNAAKILEGLKITKLTRQNPAEVLYDLKVYLENNKKRLLEDKYTWTARRASDGSLVSVGHFMPGGANVSYWFPDDRSDYLGVSLSRSS